MIYNEYGWVSDLPDLLTGNFSYLVFLLKSIFAPSDVNYKLLVQSAPFLSNLYLVREGFKKKQKTGIFQIWSETPTHPCKCGKSGKKIKFLLF